MLTEFGKLLRKYRIDHNLILKKMADTLNIPSSYLSAIEMGRKTVSKEFLNKLYEAYSFSDVERQQLNDAAELSAGSIKLDLNNASLDKRNMVLSFARKFDTLDEKTVKKIMDYLKEGGDDE